MVAANLTTAGDVGESDVQSVEAWENPGYRPPETQASGGGILSAQDWMLDGVLSERISSAQTCPVTELENKTLLSILTDKPVPNPLCQHH